MEFAPYRAETLYAPPWRFLIQAAPTSLSRWRPSRFPLTDAPQREAIGRIVSRILRPQAGHDPLLEAMERPAADAKGLTPEVPEAELAAHKTEGSR